MSTIRVKRVTFQLDVDDPRTARRAGERLRSYSRHRLGAAIETGLDSVDQSRGPVALPRLELDLGTLTITEMEDTCDIAIPRLLSALFAQVPHSRQQHTETSTVIPEPARRLSRGLFLGTPEQADAPGPAPRIDADGKGSPGPARSVASPQGSETNPVASRPLSIPELIGAADRASPEATDSIILAAITDPDARNRLLTMPSESDFQRVLEALLSTATARHPPDDGHDTRPGGPPAALAPQLLEAAAAIEALDRSRPILAAGGGRLRHATRLAAVNAARRGGLDGMIAALAKGLDLSCLSLSKGIAARLDGALRLGRISARHADIVADMLRQTAAASSQGSLDAMSLPAAETVLPADKIQRAQPADPSAQSNAAGLPPPSVPAFLTIIDQDAPAGPFISADLGHWLRRLLAASQEDIAAALAARAHLASAVARYCDRFPSQDRRLVLRRLRPSTDAALLALPDSVGRPLSQAHQRLDRALTALLLDDLGAAPPDPASMTADYTAAALARAGFAETTIPDHPAQAGPPDPDPPSGGVAPWVLAYLDFGTRPPGGDPQLAQELGQGMRAEDPALLAALNERLPDPLVAARLSRMLPLDALMRLCTLVQPEHRDALTVLESSARSLAGAPPDVTSATAAHALAEAALASPPDAGGVPLVATILDRAIETLAARYGLARTALAARISAHGPLPDAAAVALEHVSFLYDTEPLATAPAHAPAFPEPAEETGTAAGLGDARYEVQDAGLILLWPFLQGFLDKLGLLSGDSLASPGAAHEAAHCLGELVAGRPGAQDTALALAKLLAGLAPSTGLVPPPEPDPDRIALGQGLLVAVCQHWTPMTDSGPDGLRLGFLRRFGTLHPSTGDAPDQLVVEPQPQDLLLDMLPWPYNDIRLPWMARPLRVQWR